MKLLHRLDVGLRKRLTMATLADELERIHGGSTIAVTEELPDGTVRVLTHADITALVGKWSAAVAARTDPGQPVVVATANGVDQLLVSLAVSRAGRVPAPVNALMTTTEIEHVINDCGATLAVRDSKELATGRGARSRVPEAARPEPGDTAALFYTSGTTGSPKGAELTHRALVGQLASATLVPPVLGGHEVLLSLPVAHIMGFVALLAPMVMGLPVYFLDHFSPTRVLEIIEQRRVAAFMGVPAMYRMMLEAGAADHDLTSVRAWMSGADVMPSEVARAFKSMGASVTLPIIGPLGEAAFLEGYGMVEVGGGVAAKVSPPFLPIGLGDSLGLPLPGWHLRVVDHEGLPVTTGRVGELQLKGPGVLRGYWGDAVSSAAVLTPDGWLRTGDLVRSGPFGTVVFHGRTKNVVMSGGYSVYPIEVEAGLEEHPDVLEAAVVGLPHDKLGEITAAAVRLRPGAKVSAQDLRVWAEERMARYKAPRRIVIVDELPRSSTRKIQRDKLIPLFDSDDAGSDPSGPDDSGSDGSDGSDDSGSDTDAARK